MKLLTADEVQAHQVAQLGLDPSALDLASIEAVAGALRRCASFLCPCSKGTLVRNVANPLRALVDNAEALVEIIEQTLEAMISYGDLLEYRQVDSDGGFEKRHFVYGAPPSFVARESGAIMLLGITRDQSSALPDDLARRIEHVNHRRSIIPMPLEDLRATLLTLGLVNVRFDRWSKLPTREAASDHVGRLDGFLATAPLSGDAPGLMILDPETSASFYPSRWTEPRGHSGRFIARRTQRYGSDLWCYAELDNGRPVRLVDLPRSIQSRWRGCDEAWHLQMAIDATRGAPQHFRIRRGPAASHIIEFFSPVPMWARRRWDAIGEPALASGCLFAYRLSEAELDSEVRFAKEMLWLTESSATSR